MQLIQHEGKWQGMLTFPWSYGVVFTRITRKQFDAAGLGSAIEPNRVVCSDEMLEDAEPEAFQSRLWDMFPQLMRGTLSLPQIDRVRWNLFPEVRVPEQGALFDDADDKAAIPDFLRVMDLQQEQLARSLGDGHRVIHGVAGSGKTMILGYRAEYLAKATTDLHKPVLVLCYNEPLAVKLHATMQAKGLADRVHVRHFHKWCRDQLVAFGQPLPSNNLAVGAKMDQMVNNVIDGVDRKMIPSGQYLAVLVDEGHDFAPEWLKLVTQMVDPTTNSLLLLYDDAQSIYERRRGKPFSFKSVGVQAQGRTTILKINYRNTRQILQTASAMATELSAAPGEGRRWRAARPARKLRPRRPGAYRHRPAEHPSAGRPHRGAHGQRAQRGARVGRYGGAVSKPDAHGGVLQGLGTPPLAAQGAQGHERFRPRRRHHQGDDASCQQGAGVPGGRGDRVRARRCRAKRCSTRTTTHWKRCACSTSVPRAPRPASLWPTPSGSEQDLPADRSGEPAASAGKRRTVDWGEWRGLDFLR